MGSTGRSELTGRPGFAPRRLPYSSRVGRCVVLLNGISGSGKTTLAGPLGQALEMPVIAKDAIKERLADIAGAPVSSERLGALASDTMWELTALVNGPVIVESIWLAGIHDHFLERGLRVAGAGTVVGVWCDVPLQLAYERFRTRPRHPIHDDADRPHGWWHELFRDARPCAGHPLVEVSTVVPVDVPALAARIRALLDGGI
jgi:predicted kinase